MSLGGSHFNRRMSEEENNIDDQKSSSEAELLLQKLQRRADDLLSDLKAFQSCLRSHGRLQEVEVGFFRKGVESEVKSLQSISKLHSNQDVTQPEDDAEAREGRFAHALRSSNLPFYEAVWHTARQRRGIIALGKRISLISGNFRSKQGRERRPRQEKYGVVDVVADDGLEWIKVSTVTEKRLLFDIAKEGWAGYGDDSDTEEDDHENRSNNDIELEIVQLAKHLRNASRHHRIRHQHPKVLFVLPKIQEGTNTQIDAVIADIRATGATVTCASTSHVDTITNSLEDVRITSKPDYEALMPSSSIPSLTSTINIDCTVLLALISDISHISREALPPSPANISGTYHKAILKQIDLEEKRPLLPGEIYPLMRGRNLVCTNHAAIRMQEIVETMGTETERIRSLLLFGREDYKQYTAEQLRNTLRPITTHAVPDDLQLPIEIVNYDGLTPELPEKPEQNGKILGPGIIPSHHKDLHNNQSPISNHVHPTISQKDISIARRITNSTTKPLTTNKSNSNTGTEPDKPPTSILSKINTSVFLYGWLNNLTTITSNKAVAMQLKRKINEILDLDEKEDKDETEMGEFQGPQIYICDTARSLVGKEKVGNGNGNGE